MMTYKDHLLPPSFVAETAVYRWLPRPPGRGEKNYGLPLKTWRCLHSIITEASLVGTVEEANACVMKHFRSDIKLLYSHTMQLLRLAMCYLRLYFVTEWSYSSSFFMGHPAFSGRLIYVVGRYESPKESLGWAKDRGCKQAFILIGRRRCSATPACLHSDFFSSSFCHIQPLTYECVVD